MGWKKHKQFEKPMDHGIEEFKKSKIMAECGDINELLRIRKCYGKDEGNFLNKSSLSYRNQEEEQRMEGKNKNYLLQKPLDNYGVFSARRP